MKYTRIALILTFIVGSIVSHGQGKEYTNSFLKFNLYSSWDALLKSQTSPYNDKLLNGINVGLFADKYWKSIGAGMEFGYARNESPRYDTSGIIHQISTSNLINYYESRRKTTRAYFGIGPSYKKEFSENKFLLEASLKGGISLTKGGNSTVKIGPSILSLTLFDDLAYSNTAVMPYGKVSTRLNYFFAENLGFFIEGFFSKYFNSVSTTSYLDRSSLKKTKYSYCLSSVGLGAGLTYTINRYRDKPVVEKKDLKKDIKVTVLDLQTGQSIYNANVVLKDSKGNQTTYQTDKNGIVTFKQIPTGEYTVSGNLNGINATSISIYSNDFKNSLEHIMATLKHNDPRFTLLGYTTNKTTGKREPHVEVSLMNEITRKGETAYSKSNNGEFMFQLVGNSTYKLHGKKDSYISNIENVSTVGLNRSTTLYVNLELGIEEATINKTIKLSSIYYDYNSSEIRKEASSDLLKLSQFLNDNSTLKIELHSHTDSRGNSNYNIELSQQRSNSIKNYLIENGINPQRIKAIGFGEQFLLNACSDGVNCTEEQHQKNRRTEFKVVQ
jgi:outer membrane protein OmpA-like peptidoglycan-associated protein